MSAADGESIRGCERRVLRRLVARRRQRVDESAALDDAAPSFVEDVRSLLATIEQDYGTQALLLQVLLELLVEKGVLDDDEFVERLDAVDMRDGLADGTIGFHGYTGGGGI